MPPAKQIANDKLRSLPGNAGTIHFNKNFRLDMQGLTTKYRFWNLQIQINKETTLTSLKTLSGTTIATVICPQQFDAKELKAMFIQSAETKQRLGPEG
ncbi:hypothetical protein NA56DRAFT_707350 [Hyaloscypha hepaticicola]|uniref:Uncharacterized protein n=1 Tax=Hyaloscypha hepaticicola TaxID=2082293 RepID=A0A2J6PV89_9HELO|nr:hypothetical protein NA56DRAFT_707350 [Hyaloscypha hepaticicola]